MSDLRSIPISESNDNLTSVKPTVNLRHSVVMHRNEADKRNVAARVRETIVTRVRRSSAYVSHVRVRDGNRESARHGNGRSRPTTKMTSS